MTVPMLKPISRSHQPPRSVASLLAEGDVFASSMLLLAIDAFAENTVQWLPTTLAEEFEETYKARPSPENLDRLMAAIGILKTDFYWQSVTHFIDWTNILANSDTLPGFLDPATVAESAWAVTEATLIEPPENPLSDKVLTFLEALCRHEGYSTPPRALAAVGVRGDRPGLVRRLTGLSLGSEIVAGNDQRAREIDQAITAELHELFDQIESLPLKTAQHAPAVTKLRSLLAPR